MTTPNVHLLRRTLAHIETHPEQWDQRTWRRTADCGTAYCFAGWAVTLAGGRWITPATDIDDQRADDVSFLVQDDDGLVDHVGTWAQQLLGLTGEQAEELFDPENPLHVLHDMVTEICEAADGGEPA